MNERLSSSPEETERLAARLAPILQPGDVVALSGDLGAGKTTFVRGAVGALGLDAAVTSPTFTIGNRYRGPPDVSHLDLYRLEAVTEAEWGALEPYFEDAIVFVEWPAAAEAWLPEPRFAVSLTHGEGGARTIRLAGAEADLLRSIFGG